MATRRLSSLCRHLAVSAARMPSSDSPPNVSTFQCKNGLNIFTKAWGHPSSDRKALALHGYLDNSGSFDELGPALAKEGFEVVAIDFPGHGRSDALSNDSWYQLLDYPEHVLEAARSLGWMQFSLVGHSMGGVVACLVAAAFPELVQRCVFIDVLGPIALRPATSPARLRRSIESRRILLGKTPKPYPSFDDAVRQRLKSVTQWGDGQTMTWEGATRLVVGGTEPGQGDGQVKFTNDARLRAASPMYLTEEDALSYLAGVTCPSMLVRGATGMVKDTPSFLARKEAFGGPFRDLVLPGSHHLHLDRETAPMVASHVAAFLLDQGRSKL